MFNMKNNKINYEGRKYEVVPHNPEWSVTFEKESQELKEIFGGDAIEVEHIGSTSIPNLDSKPTIDILIIADNITITDQHIAEMKSHGYKYLGEYVMPDSRLFVKEREEKADRLFNVHIFPKGHKHIKEMIGLRDYFRDHPEEVEKYAKLKKELATKYPDDYGQYRKFKDEYVEDLKKRVLDPD